MQPNGRSCEDCHPFPQTHLENWITDHVETLIAPLFQSVIPERIFSLGDQWIGRIFTGLGIVSPEKNFSLDAINPITAAFVRAGRKRGIEFTALKGPFGYIPYMRMKIGERVFEFEKLPRAEFKNKSALAHCADDKWKVKQELRNAGFPFIPGQAFWWFQKPQALRWAQKSGYPVIVKPRRGSLSQHMYPNIQNEKVLRAAIKKAVRYSPVFIVEKFIPGLTLYRITVVDGDAIFPVKRLPPHVTGNGNDTVRELMHKQNIPGKNIDVQTLQNQRLTLDAVPQPGQTVRLHYKIVLALGSVIQKMDPNTIHPENLAMCKEIVRRFGTRLAGIDFLAEDISRSWREQTAAIIELNSLPNILMHTFPRTSGEPENEVAEAIADLALKYYR